MPRLPWTLYVCNTRPGHRARNGTFTSKNAPANPSACRPASRRRREQSSQSTSAGVRAIATCTLLFRITDVARSVLFWIASRTPTTFSTALPAMATITRPTNASDIPNDAMVGRNASTKRSEVSAAPPAPTGR